MNATWCKRLSVFSCLLIVASSVNIYSQAINLSDSTISNINFFISNYSKSDSLKRKGDGWFWISSTCEVNIDLDDSIVGNFYKSIDSIVPSKGKTIDNCFDSHEGYDSYFCIHLKNYQEIKMQFRCKNYKTGILFIENESFFIYLNGDYSKKIEKIASLIRKKMYPCRGL